MGSTLDWMENTSDWLESTWGWSASKLGWSASTLDWSASKLGWLVHSFFAAYQRQTAVVCGVAVVLPDWLGSMLD